jgi:two-component system, chemotaxis family, protein-glutamate methylesterase/glutaminase
LKTWRNVSRMGERDIIAIGGSLGAIDAMKEICARLPPDLPAAIFVVIHTVSNREHLLAEIFGRAGPLPAHTATDGQPVERGHIYLAPADHHLIVMQGFMRLGRGPRENMTRPSVDPLFRSVAATYGPRATGIVLTGLLNDGAAGVVAIKRCGGTTIVQNPADAIAADMPMGALRAADIDYRAPAADIPRILNRLVGQRVPPRGDAPADLELEIDIALGGPVAPELMRRLGDPVALSCPACGGVLNEMKDRPPLRFRCQVGHAYTAEAVAAVKEHSVDEAIRVALRIIEERAVLLSKMAREAAQMGRDALARNYRKRFDEYERYVTSLRKAAVSAPAPGDADAEPMAQAAQDD